LNGWGVRNLRGFLFYFIFGGMGESMEAILQRHHPSPTE
jgi:hypothetical protein